MVEFPEAVTDVGKPRSYPRVHPARAWWLDFDLKAEGGERLSLDSTVTKLPGDLQDVKD